MKESDPNQLASNRSVYASPFFTLDTQQQLTDGNILTEQQYDEQTSKINQLFSPHGLLNSNKFSARFNANYSQTHRDDYQNIFQGGVNSQQQQQAGTVAKKSQPGFIRELQYENEIIDIADYDDDSMSKDSQNKQQAKSNASDQSRRPRKSSDIESIGDANPQEPGGDEAHKRAKSKSQVSKHKTRIYDLDQFDGNNVQPISKGQQLWAIVKRDIYQVIKFKNIVDFSIAEKNKLRFKGTSAETARVKDPVFFIMPDSWFKYLWDMLTGFIQIYYPIVIPLRICFGVPVQRSWFWDIGLESIFLLDMVFSCITGVLTGGEIVKSKRILIRKYARVLVCGCALLPALLSDQTRLGIYQDNSFFSLLEEIPVLSAQRHLFSLQRVSTLILLCVHLLSCLWIQAGREPDSGESYDLPEKFKRIGWISHYHPDEANEDGTIYGSVYVSAYYYVTTTIATIGYGDYSSLTVAEELFTMFCEFFGIALFGYISGGLVSAVQISLLKGQLKKSEKRAEFDQWLFQREKNKLEPLNHRLLQNLRAINHFNQENNFSDFFHETQCFHYLPKEQKRRVFNLLFTDIATFFGAFFRNISELAMIQEIFEFLHPLTFLPEDEVIKYRSLSRGIYFIVQGKVHISCRKKKPNKIPAKQRTIPKMQGTLRETNKKQEEDLVYFRKLSPGSFFGEFCVLDKYSSFEFVAGEKEPLFLLFIPKQTFQEICGKYKQNYTWIKKFAFYRFKYFKMEKNDFEKKLHTYETIKKELTSNSKKGSFFMQAKNEEKKDKNDSKDQVNVDDADDNLNSQKHDGFEIPSHNKKSETNTKKLIWKLQGQKTISSDNIFDTPSTLTKSQQLETAKKISQQAKRESKIASQLIGEEISEEEEKSSEDSFENRIPAKGQIQGHSDDNHDFLHSKESDFESATPATTKVFMDTQKNTEEKRIESASLIQFDTKELVTSQSIEDGTQEKQASKVNLKINEEDNQQIFDVMISPDEISFSNQNSNTKDTAAHHIDYLMSSNNLNLQSQSQEGEEQQQNKNSQQFSSPGDQINSATKENQNCQEGVLLGREEATENQHKFSKQAMRQLFQQTKTIQFEEIQNDLKDKKDVSEEEAVEVNYLDKNNLNTNHQDKKKEDCPKNGEKTNMREELKDIRLEKSTITIKDIFGGQHKQSTQANISRNQTQGNDNKDVKDIDRFSLVMISSSSSNSSRNQSEQEKNTQKNQNQYDFPFDYGKEDNNCDEDDYDNEDEENGEENMDEVLEMVKLEKEERQVRRAFRNKTSKNSSEEIRLNQLQVRLAETAGLRLPSENALSSSHLKNVAQHKLFKSLLQKKIDVLVRKAEMIQCMQSSKKVKFIGQSNEENGPGGDFNRNMKSMGSMKMQSAVKKQNTLKSLKTKKHKTNPVGSNTYDQQRENVQRQLLRSQDISGTKRDQEETLQFEEEEEDNEVEGEEAGIGSKIPCEEQYSSDSWSFQSSIQQRDEQNTNLEFQGQKSKGQLIEAEIDKVFCSRAPNFELMLMIDKMKEEHRMKYQQDIQGDVSDDYQNYKDIQNFDISNQEDNNLDHYDLNCNNDLAHLDDSMEIPIDCIKPNFDFDDLQSIPGYLGSQLTILEKRIEQMVQNMYEECGSCVKKITKLSNLKESRKKHEIKDQQEQQKQMNLPGTPQGAQNSSKYGRSNINNTQLSPQQNSFMGAARNYLQTKKLASQIIQKNSSFAQLDGQTVHLGNSLLFNLKQIFSGQGKEFNFFSELKRRNKLVLLQQKQQEEQHLPKKKLKKSKSEKLFPQQGIFNGNQDRRKSKHMSIMQFPDIEKQKSSRKSKDKTDENDNDETKQPHKLVLSEAAKVKEEFHKMFAMLRSRTEGCNGSSNSSFSNSLD